MGPQPSLLSWLVMQSLHFYNIGKESTLHLVGVRAWLARGYFIPGGASQRGGGQAPAFRVARCQTWSGVGPKTGRKLSKMVGVRAWLARGYFIPGGASQRGGGQAPAFRVARCRTQSLVDIRAGPVGSCQASRRGPVWVRILVVH